MAYASTSAGAARCNASPLFRRRSISAVARRLWVCQAETVAIMQSVSGRNRAIEDALPRRSFDVRKSLPLNRFAYLFNRLRRQRFPHLIRYSHKKPPPPNQSDWCSVRFDLDPAVSALHVQDHPRLQTGCIADLLGDDDTAGLIDGCLHGRTPTTYCTIDRSSTYRT